MKIYLTNLASDVSGYKLALIGQRNPAATSTAATTVTTLVAGSHSLTAGGTKTAMTLTAGGSAAKWLTKPLKAAITVPAIRGAVNIWGFTGSSAARHASVDFDIAKYTTSLQSAFVTPYTTSHAQASIIKNPDLNSTTVVNRNFPYTAPSQTSFAAGDRIAITGYWVNAFLTSLVAQHSTTATMDIDGNTDGADGDTWIDLPVFPRTIKRQAGPSNTLTTWQYPSKTFFVELMNAIDACVASGEFTMDGTSLQSFYDQLQAERDNH